MTLSRFCAVVAVAVMGMLLSAQPAGATAFILDDDFELGMANWDQTVIASGDFVGFWTDSGLGDPAAYSGVHALLFQAQGDEFDEWTATLSTTVGASYTLAYRLMSTSLGDDPSNTFEVRWNGFLLGGGLSFVDGPDIDYTLFTTTVVATSASSTLSFGGRNNPGYTMIDDVTVSDLVPDTMPVPEPASLLLLGTGLALGARRIRRRNAAA